nr:ORFIII-like polyprotein [Tanacetum cinerariifolium]
MCKDAALAKELRDLSLCSAIPIPGYYKNNRKKYGIRKSRTYKGKPHNSHVKPFKRKYKDNRGRVKKCKCFICRKEGHFAKDCRSKQGNIARSTIYQELDLDDNWDIVSADFNDSSVYSISEGEGDVHQNISIMVQDTPIEEAAFMAIEESNESDDEQDIKEDYDSHHAFMFHPGPPTKIADMVQFAGSWKPDKELPTQSKSCEHDWKENALKAEQMKLEEENDEEIRNSQIARPFMEAEAHYSRNTTTAPKIRKITNQLYNVKVEFEIPSCPMFGTTTIIDMGASACCINKKVIPKEALEPLTQIVFFNGMNSRQQAIHKKKQGYFLIEGNKFKIPLIYAFDMRDINGFHQVAMDEESIPWTAFLVPGGLYEWLVMPFGLKNAPAEHAKHLEKMLKICEDNGLVLSPTKMKIVVSIIDFLGVVIGDGTIKWQPHIIKKIVNFNEEELKTKKGLRSFLGILNYARNHIPKLGILLRTLYEKTNAHGDKRMKSSDYKWMHGRMGGIVKWKKSKEDPRSSKRICTYASGKFSTTQSIIDAEINACINTLEKLKIYYLDKQEGALRTDCQAIISFYNITNSNKSLRVRWIKFADAVTGTGVKINIEHIEGKHNTLIDSLSRLVNLCFAECTGDMKELATTALHSVEKVLQSPNAFQKNMKITYKEVMKISNHFQESSQKLSSHMKNQEHYTNATSSKPTKPQSEWINLMHGDQLSMPCETLSEEISTSILRLLHTAKTFDLVWIWMGGDYENREHNIDFHPIVDFVEASPLRDALTFKPTIYVSHIRQFWSTTRIKTTEEGTKILATVDGILRTVTESSLKRNLKLQDEEGISSLPDTELFENLTLMGYNISPHQKFTFQKGQFSHQWKFLIHTIMQCLSPKSTGFNEFSSNIATAFVCLATNRTYNFSKMIFDGLVKNVNNKVLKFLMYPSLQRQHLELLAKFQAQEVEINRLKEKVKILEDKEGVIGDRSRDDASIKGRRID